MALRRRASLQVQAEGNTFAEASNVRWIQFRLISNIHRGEWRLSRWPL